MATSCIISLMRSGHCKPLVAGVQYADPDVPEERGISIAFIFVEQEGRLMEVLECRGASF
ncbi:MAG: hypothetical protein H6568_07580 [Lewinellaceae bacterium]|nr:hypothetical protein [Saprospiraceae bacterium]MCB9312613.1 hypothetical protein [Lewinellaceae bacterium]HRW75766.1 hypothetical protein [Saprospiraceae bacterium]